MEVPQTFCVRWNSYKSNLQTAFPKLLTSEHFVDVTLACEKQYLKCHKVVLSACSVYFEDLLVNNPCQHPIIFMKDVAFWEMKALVEFMYKGEVNVSQDQLDSLLKSAESLQIRGLSGNKQWISDVETEMKKRKREDDDDDRKALEITPSATVKNEIDDMDDDRKYSGKSEEEEGSLKIVEDDETSYLENTDDDTRLGENYAEGSREPGSSAMAEFISLEELDDVSIIKDEADGGPSTSKRKTHLSIRNSRRSCYKQYTMQSMWAALNRIEQGLSVYRASLEYGVPRKTLRNWMKKYNILSYFDLRKQNRLRNELSD